MRFDGPPDVAAPLNVPLVQTVHSDNTQLQTVVVLLLLLLLRLLRLLGLGVPGPGDALETRCKKQPWNFLTL